MRARLLVPDIQRSLAPRGRPTQAAADRRHRPTLQLVLLLAALPAAARAVDADDYSGCAGTVYSQTLHGTPATYLGLLAQLVPGTRLELAAGTYPSGLPLAGVNGAPGNCIAIEGPPTGSPAVFLGRNCCNTVSLANSSYLEIRNLELDGQGLLGDAVKAEGTADWVHHVTIENLHIHGHDADQQIVGINSKCPAWNWVIRDNRIAGAGTGIYLGSSDGSAEHVNSLIEHNLIHQTLGYNLQIKHQTGRDTGLGIPASGTTVIRHNVFSKATGAGGGDDARPNLLVGHWPLSGPGADDVYAIYGNFFWQNPTEALFQGEGNVAFYQNLLVNDAGDAINVQPHNDVPRTIRVFHNTVVASGVGIRITGGSAMHTQRAVGNASLATTPFSGSATLLDNVSDDYADAALYLANPDGVLTGSADRLDLYPLAGALLGGAIDWTGLDLYPDWNRDFNGTTHAGVRRGAYAGEGANPGWQLALERKPPTVLFADGFESGDLAAWVVGP